MATRSGTWTTAHSMIRYEIFNLSRIRQAPCACGSSRTQEQKEIRSSGPSNGASPWLRLEFEYVSVIERSPSGKRRYFVDTLNTDATRQQ